MTRCSQANDKGLCWFRFGDVRKNIICKYEYLLDNLICQLKPFVLFWVFIYCSVQGLRLRCEWVDGGFDLMKPNMGTMYVSYA